MTDAAVARDEGPLDGSTAARVRDRARELAEPAGVALFGFLVVALVAGSDGGFRATTQGWLALVMLWLAAVTLVLRDRLEVGLFGLALFGALVAFSAWVALSLLWTASVPSTMLDLQRDVAYIGTAAAGLVVVRRRTVPALLGGLLAAVTVLCLYGLGTRLLPDRVGQFDSVSLSYRLNAPIAYWNGLGIFASMGVLLALGMALRSRSLVARGLASAAIPALACTWYFTFSRGAWLALVVALLVVVALDPRRLQLAAGLLALAPWTFVALVEAQNRKGLSTIGATLDEAIADGHSFVVPLVLLSLASAGTAVAFAIAERRVTPSRRARQAFAIAIVATLVTAGAVVRAKEGSPYRLADRAWSQFRGAPSTSGADVSKRLFDLSSNGRIDLWSTSWRSFESRPLLGNGSGTFWQLWAANPDARFSTIEGHSLYFEALGELGIVGFVLLLALLAVPLVAFVLARHEPLAAVAAGPYVAWLVHANVDWDWELIGVSTVALLSGVALVKLAPGRPNDVVGDRWPRVVGAVALVVLAVASVPPLVAEVHLNAANAAITSDVPKALEEARSARRWAPWSPRPWMIVGDARTRVGDLAGARNAYREAIRLDPSSWMAWRLLANVSRGAEFTRARDRLQELHPTP